MFGRIFAKFFWDLYDYLGRLILANILFSVVIAGIALGLGTVFYPIYQAMGGSRFLLAAGIGLIAVITLPFPAAGFFSFLSVISQEREPEFRDFFIGVKELYASFFKLSLVFVAAFELLILNALFYVNPRVIPPSMKMATLIVSGLCAWIFLYLFAMSLFAFPMTAHQKTGIRKTLFRSFLLVTDNIGVTILTLSLFIGVIALGVLTRGMTVFFLNLALAASLANSLYDNVMKKYESREAEKRTEGDKTEKPSSWKDIKDKGFIEDRHDRYRRTLKDILKPWEY